MKRLFLLLILLYTCLSVMPQQEAQFSHNMFNILPVNPGYAGINDAICITALHRQQWVGFTDFNGVKGVNPVTTLLSIDSKVRKLHGGLGASVIQDHLGYEDNIDLKLDYSYHVIVGGSNILGLGLEFGFKNKTIDFTQLIPIQTPDPVLTGKSAESDMGMNLAAGAFYKIPNKFYFGVSATQLLGTKLSLGPNPPAQYQLKPHYYFMAGYYWPLPSNPSFEFKPSILIKTDFASTQYDINCLVEYNSRFWGGLSYRATDAMIALVGVKPFTVGKFKDLLIGYSYDITTSALGKDGRSNGSHEIMLKYCFKIEIEKIPSSYRNVRYL